MERISSPKSVVVTGGGRGIGRAVAARFARVGDRVLICARTEDELRAAAARVRSETRRENAVEAVIADQSRPKDARRLAERVSSWGTGLDILLNNASILGPMVPIVEYPIREWDSVIAVNLRGPFLVTRALLPHMNRRGRIINITSSVGRVGRKRWGAYAVSKFGLEGLSQVLADELLEREIAVYTLNPGGTRTRMRADAYPDEDLSRLRRPEEVADVLFQLASSETLFPSGSMIDIEGGRPVLYRGHRE